MLRFVLLVLAVALGNLLALLIGDRLVQWLL